LAIKGILPETGVVITAGQWGSSGYVRLCLWPISRLPVAIASSDAGQPSTLRSRASKCRRHAGSLAIASTHRRAAQWSASIFRALNPDDPNAIDAMLQACAGGKLTSTEASDLASVITRLQRRRDACRIGAAHTSDRDRHGSVAVLCRREVKEHLGHRYTGRRNAYCNEVEPTSLTASARTARL
jgi:hypothetical protein